MKKKTTKKYVFNLLETIKGHWYYIENQDFPAGITLPSATNVLEAYPNPGLDYWRENTSPEVIKEKQDDGKAQGTKVHHCAFLLSEGEVINPDGVTDEQIKKLPIKGVDEVLVENLKQPLTEREINCLKGLRTYWDEFKPVSLAQEIKIYSKKHKFAGTLDWIGYLWNKKEEKYELWLIDYKISKSHTRSYELQIASYSKALKEMRGKRTRIRLGILYLGKPTKKKYQLKEVENEVEAFKAFLLTKSLWHDLYPNAVPKMIPNYPSFKFKLNKMKGRRITIK